MSRRRLITTLVTLVFLGLFFVPSLLGLLIDWWWFQEIGYQVVFTRELVTRVLLFLIVGGLTFGVLYLNLRMAQRGISPDAMVLRLFNATPFGINDPIFSRDIGYYVFTLPGLGALLGMLTALAMVSLLL